LACGTLVEPGMHLTQIPFYPAERAQYRLDELQPTFATLVKLYPQVLKCLGCGTCTKSCPQELQVKDYMAAAMRGDIARVADLSFDCIMCGMCVSRCPAEEAQPNIAILARRLYAAYLAPKAKHLAQRVTEIDAGTFDEELAHIKALPDAELRQTYNTRDIEPE
jgi:CO dehydrogenase/acetyl-CoA synthase alpha subunit